VGIVCVNGIFTYRSLSDLVDKTSEKLSLCIVSIKLSMEMKFYGGMYHVYHHLQ
jgi:hypothetical protein